MKKTKYESLEDWKIDFKKIEAQPNDSKLVTAVALKVAESSSDLRSEIKDYLASSILETNPWYILNQVSEQYPDHKVFVKSKTDIWFNS